MEKRENKRAIGAAYEKVAGAYLTQRGYEILEYNYRCRQGEIDIIAKEGGYLVFIEVKYRKSSRNGSPLYAVNKKKQQTISRVASYFCQTHEFGEMTPCRFDVVSVTGNEISLICNAFEYCGY